MLELLKSMAHDFGAWKTQIFQLAIITVRKQTHNTVLGWLWLFLKPAMYIFCFWFALYIGIRAGGSGMTSTQYLMWLSCGVIPWFFFKDTINAGSRLFSKYKFLVNKLKFPVAFIPVFYELADLLVHFLLLLALFAMFFILGGVPDVYFAQLLLLFVFMYVFAVGWSLLTSSLTAISKDIANLITTLSTPIFWLSGVIFDVANIESTTIRHILYFDPITFIVECFRIVFGNGTVFGEAPSFIWSNPVFFACGLGTILLTAVLGLIVFSRLRKDIPDVV